MNEYRYEQISEWFREKAYRLRWFVRVYRTLPYLMVIGYGVAAAIVFFHGSRRMLAAVIIVPAVTLLLCTVFRKVVNAPRPYEQMKINPLIVKHKKGQSFPSRHMVSAGVLAVTAWYVNRPLGLTMFLVTLAMGILRPIAGVHYIKDVVAGTLIGIICGIVGFWLLMN